MIIFAVDTHFFRITHKLSLVVVLSYKYSEKDRC